MPPFRCLRSFFVFSRGQAERAEVLSWESPSQRSVVGDLPLDVRASAASSFKSCEGTCFPSSHPATVFRCTPRSLAIFCLGTPNWCKYRTFSKTVCPWAFMHYSIHNILGNVALLHKNKSATRNAWLQYWYKYLTCADMPCEPLCRLGISA